MDKELKQNKFSTIMGIDLIKQKICDFSSYNDIHSLSLTSKCNQSILCYAINDQITNITDKITILIKFINMIIPKINHYKFKSLYCIYHNAMDNNIDIYYSDLFRVNKYVLLTCLFNLEISIIKSDVFNDVKLNLNQSNLNQSNLNQSKLIIIQNIIQKLYGFKSMNHDMLYVKDKDDNYKFNRQDVVYYANVYDNDFLIMQDNLYGFNPFDVCEFFKQNYENSFKKLVDIESYRDTFKDVTFNVKYRDRSVYDNYMKLYSQRHYHSNVLYRYYCENIDALLSGEFDVKNSLSWYDNLIL